LPLHAFKNRSRSTKTAAEAEVKTAAEAEVKTAAEANRKQ